MYKIEIRPVNGCLNEFGTFNGKSEAIEVLIQAGFQLVGEENDRWHLFDDQERIVAVGFIRPLPLKNPQELPKLLTI